MSFTFKNLKSLLKKSAFLRIKKRIKKERSTMILVLKGEISGER